MPDTLTAADASARPHAAPPPSVIPAMAGDVAAPQDGPAPTKSAALFRAATGLLPVLEAGQALDAATLRRAMSTAFGASDTQGAWVWKDAYEAGEAALILFLQRYARLMRREAGAGPGGPAAMLAMLETLAALEPSQTRRSEEQLELQQFSTPLPLAYAALQAAAVRPGDTVLEPSAGTGMLAVMAQCALGDRDRRRVASERTCRPPAPGFLACLFPEAPVTRHNAEAIADRLPAIAPSVVLMNPPFSVSPGVNRMRHNADLRHLRSAFSMLPPGGRLAAITSAHCVPGDTTWADAFEPSRSAGSRGVHDAPSTGAPMPGAGPPSTPASPCSTSGGKDRGGIAIDPQARVLPTPPGCSPPFPAQGPRRAFPSKSPPGPRPTCSATPPRRARRRRKRGTAGRRRSPRPQTSRRSRIGVPSPSLPTRSSPPARTRTPDAAASEARQARCRPL